MKTVLIITGSENEYGSGHEMRMHALALELKRHKVTVQKLVLSDGESADPPLAYDLAILDRRDTAFPGFVVSSGARRIAIDNRGRGRAEADLVYDALPHTAMNDGEYSAALAAVVLPRHVSVHECRSGAATVSLYADAATARANADFPPATGRLSPQEFTAQMLKAERIACYFGQTLFEACYLGKQVQLYPVSDYHAELAEDFVRRLGQTPGLLSSLDGRGLDRLCQQVLRVLKEERK
ncbi:MAG: hypothetical protein ACOY5B_02205 [Spirochaetota bacterium]